MTIKSIFRKDPGTNNVFSEFQVGRGICTELYTKEVIKHLAAIDHKLISHTAQLIKTRVKNGGTILIAGNGGSQAIAQHSACDLGKGLFRFFDGKIRVRALGTNQPTASALANDFGFENALSAEYEMLKSSANDVVIAISSSGNSVNINNLMKNAKIDQALVIGLSGFSGGLVCANADISIHVAANNYPMVELVHQHILDLFFTQLWEI